MMPGVYVPNVFLQSSDAVARFFAARSDTSGAIAKTFYGQTRTSTLVVPSDTRFGFFAAE